MISPKLHRRPGSGTALAALRRLRPARVAYAVVVGVQLPVLIALGLLIPQRMGLLALIPAVALSHALLLSASSPFALQPRGRIHLYLGIWPALAWWSACAAFVVLSPFALLTSWALGWRIEACFGAVGGLSVITGVRSVWRNPAVHRVELRFRDLPPALDGYRIGQISDIHCGPFAPEGRVADWVRRLNALGADLIAVTGDLVVSGASHVAAVSRALGGLRAPDGVFAVMGNHDYFGAGELMVDALRGAGLTVLRNESVPIHRGDTALIVAGVDDTWTGRCDPQLALRGRRDGCFLLLLAHDPGVFDQVAQLGVPLTLSGHTHGGQIGVPLLSRRFNLARLIERYTAGLYEKGGSLLYVNRGAGTTGPPIRIGVRAELTLITLRRA